MNFLVKTQPLAQNQLGKEPFNIVAVRGRIFDIEVNLNVTDIKATFYFEFLDESGVVQGSENANHQSIRNPVKKQALASGATEEQATSIAISTSDNVIYGMLSKIKQEKYESMVIFANAYGLTLLPIEEQDGVISFEQIEEQNTFVR